MKTVKITKGQIDGKERLKLHFEETRRQGEREKRGR